MAKEKKKFEPKVKADERVEYEGAEEPEKYTNFEIIL